MDPIDIWSLKLKKPLSALSIDYEGDEATDHTEIMKDLGVHVHEADDSFVALTFLGSGCKYDIISINMDHLFGLATVKFLREIGIGSKLLGFTSGSTEMIRGFLHAGLDYCLAKPVGLLNMLAVLEKIVDDDDDDE